MDTRRYPIGRIHAGRGAPARSPLDGEPDLLQVRDRGADVAGPALRVEGAVGAEQDVVGAVEVDAAAQRVGGPEHGGVAVHLPEILDGPARQRVALDVLLLLGRGARAQLV